MHFQFDVDAEVPGFAVNDRFRSAASASFCSAKFQKNTSQGSKKVDDTETFDPNTGAVTRGSGSGQSEINANTCGKDALAFLSSSPGVEPGPASATRNGVFRRALRIQLDWPARRA